MNSSMSSQQVDHRHPVVDFADRLAARLDSLAGVPLLSMTSDEQREVLVSVARSRAQLEALHLRLLAQAEESEATVESGAGSAADWMTIEIRQVRRDARADLRLAERLEHRDVLSAAMAAGEVDVAQSRAIVAALERLPRSGELAVTEEQRAGAEAHLVQLAAHHETPRSCGSWVGTCSR